MKNNITADNYFDDFDFENATIIKHPMVKQLQENKRQFEKISQYFSTEIEVKKWDMKAYKQAHG